MRVKTKNRYSQVLTKSALKDRILPKKLGVQQAFVLAGFQKERKGLQKYEN
jgi:hypothetical protein